MKINNKYGNKKKTHEEYVAELAVKNPDVEVLEPYAGVHKKIKHRCLKHNIEWDIAPGNALNGGCCPECLKERLCAGQRKRFEKYKENGSNPLRKTHEQYVKDVAEINPNIEVAEQYIDSNTPILHRCKIDEYEWKARPYNILAGKGCPMCAGNAKKTNDDYIKELALANPNIEALEPYKNYSTSILHRCKIDGYEWMALPSVTLHGGGCPKCAHEKVANGIRKTNDEYIKELADINSQIIPLEKYVGANIPILHKCKIDGYEWRATPDSILHGCGCPKCGGHLTKTQEEYIEELTLKNSNIEVIGTYVNFQTPILHRCKIHNVEWNSSPASILQGCGCPQCKTEKLIKSKTKTMDQYVEELQIINPDVEALEKYKGANISILHQCKKDGYIWKVSPSSLLSGYGCPKCCESHGEKQIANWLDSYDISYIQQMKFMDCKDKRSLPFDFYLPNENACIEFDGKQHFEPVDCFGGDEELKYVQMHDSIKTKYCEDNNIRLLRIPYYEDVETSLQNFLFN